MKQKDLLVKRFVFGLFNRNKAYALTHPLGESRELAGREGVKASDFTEK